MSRSIIVSHIAAKSFTASTGINGKPLVVKGTTKAGAKKALLDTVSKMAAAAKVEMPEFTVEFKDVRVKKAKAKKVDLFSGAAEVSASPKKEKRTPAPSTFKTGNLFMVCVPDGCCASWWGVGE